MITINNGRLKILLASALFAAMPSTTWALTLPVLDDTYTDTGAPSTPQGNNANIKVNTNREGFVRFDLNALPSDAVITHAYLRMW